MKARELKNMFPTYELELDYFQLPAKTVLKLRRLANKYGLGKNYYGRSRERQLWYSMQRAMTKHM